MQNNREIVLFIIIRLRKALKSRQRKYEGIHFPIFNLKFLFSFEFIKSTKWDFLLRTFVLGFNIQYISTYIYL